MLSRSKPASEGAPHYNRGIRNRANLARHFFVSLSSIFFRLTRAPFSESTRPPPMHAPADPNLPTLIFIGDPSVRVGMTSVGHNGGIMYDILNLEVDSGAFVAGS